MVGTGYSWLQKYAINAGAHNIAAGDIRFLGIGRGALAYPDFARDALEKGELDERRCCKTLTYCTYLMRQKNHGSFRPGCPPFDKEGYGRSSSWPAAIVVRQTSRCCRGDSKLAPALLTRSARERGRLPTAASRTSRPYPAT